MGTRRPRPTGRRRYDRHVEHPPDDPSSGGDGRPGFANPALPVDELPRLADETFLALDPAYARLRLTIAAWIAAGVTVVTGSAAVRAEPTWIALLTGGCILVVVAGVAAAHRIEVGFMGYLIRQHDLSFRRGVISRSVATMPFSRVQHVALGRGPAERRFGLATLQLQSAGGSMAIPGLPIDVAERLKLLVADRAGQLADAEVDDDTDTRPTDR